MGCSRSEVALGECDKLTGFWRQCRSLSGEWKVDGGKEGPLRQRQNTKIPRSWFVMPMAQV